MPQKFILMLVLVSTLFLTACGNQALAPNSRSAWSMRRPDFGQPDRSADLSGIVKSISGNTVVVMKIDNPARAQTETTDTASTGTQAQQRAPTLSLGTTSGGSNRGLGGGRPSGAQDSETRKAMIERLKTMSTGEETVTIPVGIQMLKPDSSATVTAGQPEMLEATLTDIIPDKMVRIWLDENIPDPKTASFVLITQ